jgi:predicted glycoside hydrolase/deacetylase ChbG (UPF0249 family)
MIINADDFGYNSSVNKAIIESFEKGYCSSTTIMANMPGFEVAYHLVHENRLLKHTGVHLVLTEGIPLTDEIKRCVRFCNSEGIFNMSREIRFWRLNTEEKRAIAREIRAQVAKCRRHGISITHADSHRHAHEEWALSSVVIDICHEEGIPYLRLARNCGPQQKFYKTIYRQILNYRFKKAGLSRTLYFGSAADYAYLIGERGLSDITRSAEVMLHPAYNEQGMLVEKQDGIPLNEIMNMIKPDHLAESFAGCKWDRA